MIRVRVAAEQLVEGELRLSGEEHHYLMRVRRIRVGERVELFDGAGGVAAAAVEAVSGEETALRVGEVRREAAARAQLTSVIPLLKGERMDQCVEKLVEVGCDRIILWEAERAVVRLEQDKRAARLERIKAQVVAAVRQCGRATIPEVEGIWTLKEVVEWAREAASQAGGRRVVLEPGGRRLRVTPGEGAEGGEGGPGAQGGASAAVLVSGPEGGLGEKELRLLEEAGFERASLTETVLRAETAPVVAVAIWRWAEG